MQASAPGWAAAPVKTPRIRPAGALQHAAEGFDLARILLQIAAGEAGRYRWQVPLPESLYVPPATGTNSQE